MMEYNTERPKMIIPEYGRNVQSMIDYCCELKDREERNLCAKAIIQVMGQLNPHLRDVADFTHKLWDHLFIISEFRLDVDSPYPRPKPETFKEKPARLTYPVGKIKFKHYGKTIEAIIKKAKALKDGPEKDELTRLIANHLKKSYINWNKDSITDDVIFKNLTDLSDGELKLDESVALSSHQELVRTNNSVGSGGSNKPRHKFQNNKHKKHFHKHNKKH
ncbi:MAG: DUF4290 domain-containing protein [Bacteroidia bacterium]|nr:DUF4290 domain-containing protein [Bacteroidia bacterium]